MHRKRGKKWYSQRYGYTCPHIKVMQPYFKYIKLEWSKRDVGTLCGIRKTRDVMTKKHIVPGGTCVLRAAEVHVNVEKVALPPTVIDPRF